jgi:hypothetical protein
MSTKYDRAPEDVVSEVPVQVPEYHVVPPPPPPPGGDRFVALIQPAVAVVKGRRPPDMGVEQVSILV